MSEDAAVLVIVDGANVVGSVPDGWWRDRRGAAERLRDSLVPYAAAGLPGLPGPAEIVLVVEGAARGVASVAGVRVESAPGSGDDLIAGGWYAVKCGERFSAGNGVMAEKVGYSSLWPSPP
ncbi:hypothetical protein ACWEQJ_29040, partial [Streptomyces cyaneofuscatus]